MTMYKDLSKFLATMHVPMSRGKDDKILDIPERIGEQVFANLGDATLQTANDDPVKHVQFTIPTEDGGSINGAHVYYALPMGKSGSDISLHSAINVSYTTSRDLHESFLKDKLSYEINEVADATDSWHIGLEVNWANAPLVNKVQGDFLKNFKANHGDMKLLVNHIIGITQTIRVQAPVTKTPAEVRTAVHGSATFALNALRSTKGDTEASASRPWPEADVDIQVTNSSYITGEAVRVQQALVEANKF